MPPVKVRVRCLECPYRLTGWLIHTLACADKHAHDKGHALQVYNLDGSERLYIPSPTLEETW